MADLKLYNGVELPAPPEEWDEAKYPCANICYDNNVGTYYFSVFSVPVVVNNGRLDDAGTTKCIDYVLDGDAWVQDSDEYNFTGISLAEYPLIWTNTNIINTADNSVYLAASNPVGPNDNLRSDSMVTKVIITKDGEVAVSADGYVRAVATFYGLSSDTKPIDDADNADRFMEMDTGNLFLFDEANKKWLPN